MSFQMSSTKHYLEMIRATVASIPVILVALLATQLAWDLKFVLILLASITSAVFVKRLCDIPWAGLPHLGCFAVLCVVILLLYFRLSEQSYSGLPAKRVFALMVLSPAFVVVISQELVAYMKSKKEKTNTNDTLS